MDEDDGAIPELENEGEEDFTKEIAEAPRNYEVCTMLTTCNIPDPSKVVYK